MRISNEDEKSSDGDSAFARLMQLQGDFQARLVEETMRYLQKLRGPLSPTAPGTVVRPGTSGELAAQGVVGGEARVVLQLENRQRAYTMVTPQVSSLVGADGTTWFPSSEASSASVLVPPADAAEMAITIPIPKELPPGLYRGALLLLGFRNNSVPLAVTVAAAASGAAGAKAKPPTRPKQPKQPSKKKRPSKQERA